jgi:hypothetical protein
MFQSFLLSPLTDILYHNRRKIASRERKFASRAKGIDLARKISYTYISKENVHGLYAKKGADGYAGSGNKDKAYD